MLKTESSPLVNFEQRLKETKPNSPIFVEPLKFNIRPVAEARSWNDLAPKAIRLKEYIRKVQKKSSKVPYRLADVFDIADFSRKDRVMDNKQSREDAGTSFGDMAKIFDIAAFRKMREQFPLDGRVVEEKVVDITIVRNNRVTFMASLALDINLESLDKRSKSANERARFIAPIVAEIKGVI